MPSRAVLDSGHFAVEDSLDEIAGHIKRFYAESVDGGGSAMAVDAAASSR